MEKENLARGDRENGRVIIPRARARVERHKMSRILSLLFLAAIIPSVAACTAHTDCGSNAYCYDVGFFTTGVWNSVLLLQSCSLLCFRGRRSYRQGRDRLSLRVKLRGHIMHGTLAV